MRIRCGQLPLYSRYYDSGVSFRDPKKIVRANIKRHLETAAIERRVRAPLLRLARYHLLSHAAATNKRCARLNHDDRCRHIATNLG